MPFSPPAITYRTTDMTRWGVGQGSDLSATQIDINFWDIYEAIVDLQSSSLGKQIAYITTSTISPDGEGLVVVYTDHTFDGPFPLPSLHLNFRGVWQASTSYAVNDVFSQGMSLYICIYPTSGQATFDPQANDGFGHNFYQLIWTLPAIPVTTVSASSYTLQLSDANSYIRFTNAAGCTVMLPAFADVPWVPFTEVHLRDATLVSGGGVTVVPLSPVIIDSAFDRALQTGTYGATLFLKNWDTDMWDIGGLQLIT